MSRSRESAIQEILTEGLDDWVPIDRVIGEARDSASDEGVTLRDAAVGLVRALVDSGLMIPGNITEDGFEPWKGNCGQLTSQVIRQCDELGWEPLGAGCWLANTPEGDRAAQGAAESKG